MVNWITHEVVKPCPNFNSKDRVDNPQICNEKGNDDPQNRAGSEETQSPSYSILGETQGKGYNHGLGQILIKDQETKPREYLGLQKEQSRKIPDQGTVGLVNNYVHGSKIYRRRKETEDRQGMERRRKVVPRHRTDSWLWNHGKQAIFWTNICANLCATRPKQGLGMEPETGGSEEDDKPKEDGRKRKRRKGHGSKRMTRQVRMEEIGKDEMVERMELGTDEIPVEMMEVEEGVKKEPGNDEKGGHEEMDVF